MQNLDRILKALAEPTRLRILNLLLDNSFCVCELETALGLPQPLLSRHLAYLRACGLVEDQRTRTRVRYSLALRSELGQALREFLEKAFSLDEGLRAERARERKSHEDQGAAVQL